MNSFVHGTSDDSIDLYNAKKQCGDNLSLCSNAFGIITANFPKCLDLIVDASVFTGGRSDLKVAGDLELV